MAIVAKSHLHKAALPAAPVHRAEIQPRARVRITPPANDVMPEATVTPAAPAPAKRNYTVGYARPPKHTQFKKGKSGNPKGRPKGAKGLKTIARELLSEKVSVRTAGGIKKMRKIEAMVHKVMEKAFAGDMRAIHSLLQLYASSVPDEPVLTAMLADAPAIPSDAHDEAILDALRRTLRDDDDRR
jgi:hypothetical protein